MLAFLVYLIHDLPLPLVSFFQGPSTRHISAEQANQQTELGCWTRGSTEDDGTPSRTDQDRAHQAFMLQE